MKTRIIITGEPQRSHAIQTIRDLPKEVTFEIIIQERKKGRNLEQNAKMWAMLTDISEQVVWHGQKLSKEEYKDIFTASLKRQKVAPGLDGGFVVLGTHTSKMSISEMSELIELMTAFGTQQGVKYSRLVQEGE